MPNYVIKTTDDTLLPTKEAGEQAAGLRAALLLGTLATQNGTFSGKSSGTNTGDQTITLTGDATGSGAGNINVSVNKVNGVPLDSLGDGILKIVGGEVSVAPAYDSYWPILNQNTTGSAGSVLGTNITGNTLASNVVTSSLTTVGSIATGQWQSTTPVGIAYGGTGAKNKTDAFTALQPQNLFATGAAPTFAGLTLNGTLLVGLYASIEETQGNISTRGTISANGAISTQEKLITIANASIATDDTADGAGITVPSSGGAKSLKWNTLGGHWTSNQNFNIELGKTYKINSTDVLSATTIGSSVITSSLTTVGTISSGYWNSRIGTAGTAGTNYVTAQQVINAVNASTTGTLDGDLNAIATLNDNSTGYLKKTAPNGWALEAIDTTTFALKSELSGKSDISHVHTAVTTLSAGFMSADDKIKLDTYPATYTTVSFDNVALTGTSTAITPPADDASTRIATTAFVENVLSNIEDGIYTSLDSLLLNNIIDVGAASFTIADITYLNKYVRLTNTGSISIGIFEIPLTVLTIGTVITFRRTTLAGAITLTTGAGVSINDADTTSVLAGDTFMLKYLGNNVWDFI